ncbi:branched-chain-amino-acid transaminase [Niabella terrae]
MKWIFVNQEFYPADRAFIGTGDLALQRGYAAFDYFRTVDHQPLFLEDYLDRFFNSAAAMYLQMPLTKEALRTAIETLIHKNQLPESGIRMILTGGYAPDHYTPVRGNLILEQSPLVLPDASKFNKGVKIMTHDYCRDLPGVKSVNYLMGIWLQHQLRERGLDDVLYYHQDRITEFPRANVFIITTEGKLVTPARDVLEGITRKKLLELASGIMPVEQRDISREELLQAKEVFMTSTTKRLLPVVAIDGIQIGDGLAGTQTRLLKEAFLRVEQQELTQFSPD